MRRRSAGFLRQRGSGHHAVGNHVEEGGGRGADVGGEGPQEEKRAAGGHPRDERGVHLTA